MITILHDKPLNFPKPMFLMAIGSINLGEGRGWRLQRVKGHIIHGGWKFWLFRCFNHLNFNLISLFYGLHTESYVSHFKVAQTVLSMFSTAGQQSWKSWKVGGVFFVALKLHDFIFLFVVSCGYASFLSHLECLWQDDKDKVFFGVLYFFHTNETLERNLFKQVQNCLSLCIYARITLENYITEAYLV